MSNINLDDIPDENTINLGENKLLRLNLTEKLTGFIYSIINIETEEEYIGQTYQDYQSRWKQHFRKIGGATKLYKDMDKYGTDKFKKSIIEVIGASNLAKLKKLLDERETYYIDKRNTYESGYNQNKGNGDKSIAWYTFLLEKRRVHKCEECDLRFCSDDSLRIHKHEKHGGEKPFKCNHEGCNFKTTFKNSLNQHTRTHTNERPFVCDFKGCDKKFKTSSQLKTHKNIHYEEKSYKCEECEYTCKTNMNLISHRKVHSEERPYKCTIEGCEQAFKTSKSLKKHLKSKKHNPKKCIYKCSWVDCTFESEDKLETRKHRTTSHFIECDECEYKCPWEGMLKTHKDRKHNKIRRFKCNECEYEAYYEAYIAKHKIEVHSKKEKYVCTLCNKYKTNCKADFNKHLSRVHSETKKYSCPLENCEFKTNYKKTLVTHAQFHENLKCKIGNCGHYCTSLKEQTKHKATVHKIYPHNCDNKGCNFGTLYKDSLKRHIENVHKSDKKIHKCDKCVFETSNNILLQHHLKNFHNDCSLKCNIDECLFSTNCRRSLAKHTKEHEKHTCGINGCKFYSNLKINRIRHQAEKHNIYPYKCNNCDYVTIYSICLKRHNKKVCT